MPKKNNTPAKPALAPEEALFQAVSLCRKAGALTMGFDAVEEACVKGKAWLVMTASDASAKTVQRLNYAVGDLVDVITMPLTQDRLADISRKAVFSGIEMPENAVRQSLSAFRFVILLRMIPNSYAVKGVFRRKSRLLRIHVSVAV